MGFRKPLVWIAGIAGGIVLLIAAAVVSAPLWFDSEGVKTRIVTLIANATGGNTRFERIDIRLFPLPGATVTGAVFSLPGQFELDAQSASVDLDLLALVSARIRISSVSLVAPDITVQLREPEQDPEPLSTGTADQAVREVFAHIAKRAPGIQVIVEEGSVSLLASGRQPISFDDLELRAEANGDRIEASVSCTSNLWEHLALTMNIAEAELTGNGTLKVVGLRAHNLGRTLGLNEAWPVRDAVTDANVRWQMKGLTDILAEGNLSAPAVSLAFGERHLDVQRLTIDVSALLRNGVTEISIRHMALDYPRLDATAKLARSKAGTFALQVTATDVQLSELQDAAARLAPDAALLARTRMNIRNGTITALQLSNDADTLPGLLRPETYHAQLEFAELEALVPHIDTQIREARGTVSLNAGKLEMANASARVGNSILSEANVSASLGSLLSASPGGRNATGAEAVTQESAASGKNATSTASSRNQFELIANQIALSTDARLSLDLAEVLEITKQAMRDNKTRLQLDDIKQLSGRADFSVSVTTESKKPEVRLDVSRLQTTVRHAKVPFAIPVRLSRGDLRYVDDAIYTQGLEGAIGASTFKNVNTRIGIDAPNTLRASNGSAQLSLDELMRWAAALPELSKQTDKIGKMAGKLSVSVEKIEGPLRSPEKLQYVLTASPQGVSINEPGTGQRFAFNGGAIDISHDRIRVNDVTFSTLDASIRVGGEILDYRNGLTNIQAGISGATGLKSLEWLRLRTGLADAFQMRNPLQISGIDVNWRRDRELMARGKLQVTKGPAIGFATRVLPDHIEVEHVSLRDELSDVNVGIELKDTRFDFRFKGKLVQRSIARVFKQQHFQFGELSGAIRATGDWRQPDRTAATGALQGSMIAVPAPLLIAFPVPVTLEKFSLEGRDQTLLIKSAIVAVGDSKLDVSGSFGVSGDQYLLDADISSKRFDVPLPSRDTPPEPGTARDGDAIRNTEATIGRLTSTGEEQLTILESVLEQIPGSGQIRINIGQLRIGRQTLAPFVATTSLKEKQLVVRLQQARLCSILLTGGLRAEFGGHASLDVEVHTNNTPIERSIPCLTKQNILMTGLMDVDAKFVAAGTGDEFLESLRATYVLWARDGEIRKFDAMGEVIEVVNETEAAEAELPDIKTSSLIYETISVKGNVDLRTLRVNEFVIDLESAKMVAQGSLDIPTERINATVLVAPLGTFNKIIDRLPILGRIFGGSVLAVPVGISGTIKEPVVLPLAPTAVAGRMVDILTNTLKLPADLLNTGRPNSNTSNSSNDPATSSNSN